MNNALQELLWLVAGSLVVATVVGVLGLFCLHRSLRRLRAPEGADLLTTLRMVPFGLVVVLDLLDFGLDVFATPIVWVVLSRYRLQSLRNLAALEDLIPFTQLIPTMSIAWLAVRLLGLGTPANAPIIDTAQPQPGYYVPRKGGAR